MGARGRSPQPGPPGAARSPGAPLMRSPEASVPGPSLGSTDPAPGPHGQPPGRTAARTAPRSSRTTGTLPVPPQPAGGKKLGPGPRYRGPSSEQGPGPGARRGQRPGNGYRRRYRDSTGKRGETREGWESLGPRCRGRPCPAEPRGRHSPQRRGRPARRPRPPPLTDFKRGSAVRTSQSAPAARPRRAPIGQSAARPRGTRMCRPAARRVTGNVGPKRTAQQAGGVKQTTTPVMHRERGV